jgi:hypothetical protein
MVIPPSSSFYAHFRRKTSGKSFLAVGKAREGLVFSGLFCYTGCIAEMFTNEVTSMEQHGFIQDMLDVKVLILFVMAKLSYPVTLQTIYELCYQDDKLSYFDVSVAVPQMVQSGHLQQLPDDTYVITDKGREHEEITCDAIAYPVMQRALMAVQRYNTRIQRKGLIETKIEQEETGDYLAQLCLRDDAGVLMKLELAAPTLSQARTLVRAYEKQADAVYQQLLCQLLDEKESGHAEL